MADYGSGAKDYLHIATSATNYTVELISIDGTSVYLRTGLNGITRIPIYDLTTGVYIARISDGISTITKRFTKIK